MSKTVHKFLLVVVCLCALGPATFLPTLSAHTPTFSADSPRAPHAPALPDALHLSPLAGMAIKVKNPGDVASKWKGRAGAAAGDYGTGVAGAAGDWEAKSLASEDNYKQSVVDAASKGRYGAGVRGSAAKYQKNATTLGPQRYTAGVANAQDAYAGAMAPVLQTIAGLNLPPRGVKGTNQERSNIVATALRKMKVGQ
jgi:hypothetical protein